MSKETFVRITTEDTKKTYELPGKDVPQLWHVSMEIRSHEKGYSICKEDIYLERQTLVDHGLVPQVEKDTPPPAPVPTVEDLILQLLEAVGVFPEVG